MMRVPEIEFTPTVPTLLHRAVERHGELLHVVSKTDRLTFAEAERRSAVLARRLLAAGVGKGTRVGIALPSSTEFEVAFLAVSRIGAIAMLISTTYRPAELQRVIRNGDVSVLIAGARLLERDYQRQLEDSVPGLADARHPQIRLAAMPYLRSIWVAGGDRAWATPIDLGPGCASSADADLVDEDLLTAAEAEVVPADVLLAIFTSGTSADPKAVLHTHGTAVRKVQQHTGLGLQPSVPGSRVLMVMPFFWVGGPQSLIGSLHSGSTIVAQERYDAEQALELIERERVTHVAGWPTLVQALRAHPRAPEFDLTSIVPPATSSALVRSSHGDPANLGMTETFGPHRNPAYFDYRIINPETGDDLPDGEEGEFCVRGFGLTVGLYRREREEIVDADGWYHTGDRGYIEDGVVYYTGRYSEMIKSAGANVSPLEVEAALVALDGVAQAFVFGVPDRDRGELVAAVVVAEHDVVLDPEALIRELRTVLSPYKVPSRIVVLDDAEIPRLSSGKPHKRELAERFGARAPR